MLAVGLGKGHSPQKGLVAKQAQLCPLHPHAQTDASPQGSRDLNPAPASPPPQPALTAAPSADEICNYFGVKIAMYFAWLGFYTSAMIYPAVFGSILYTFTESDQVRGRAGAGGHSWGLSPGG